jgi:inner membrane protein
MENLTHTLFGATLYRSWFERYVPGTLPLWLIGANLPDIDVVATFWGKTTYLEQHRGLSHSILGIVVLSIGMASLWWLWHGRQNRSLGWFRLFIASLVAIGTHPLLDSLNNYGVRPLLPFDNRWFYGDLVFIADPWLWLLLGGGLFLQSEGRMIERVLYFCLGLATTIAIYLADMVPISARVLWSVLLASLIVYRIVRAAHATTIRLPSQAALCLMLLYLVMLFGLKRFALSEAGRYLDAHSPEPVRRYSVSPRLANPFRWDIFAESQGYFYYGVLSLGRSSPPRLLPIPVARDHPATLKALATPDGLIMANFSRYLLADVEPDPAGSLVILRDGRFSRYSFTGFSVIKIVVPGDQ